MHTVCIQYIVFILYLCILYVFQGVNTLSAKAPFSRDDRLGWLTFCPSNLGTTVRASVHIKLPLVSKTPEFQTACDAMKLQIRGEHMSTVYHYSIP